MARRGRKRGPKTPWQRRARYLRRRCPERLKPNQIADLCAADGFARWQGFSLNYFATLRFPQPATALRDFRRGQDRVGKWLRRAGSELRWAYVWEARNGFHVHALINLPGKAFIPALEALRRAFPTCDVDLRSRLPGKHLAYIFKGTDVATHLRAVGRSMSRRIKPRSQGCIPWKRAGSTQNISANARKAAEWQQVG
jgi:hypothetical protein